MYFLLKIIQVCYLTTLIQTKQTTSYVLLAADLEDFRAMARKLVPDQLADQLAHMASGSTMKKRQLSYDYYEDNYEEDDYETPTMMTVRPTIRERTQKPKYIIQQELSKINLDDLVEKVKERLANEFKGTTDKPVYVYVPKDQTMKRREEFEDNTPPYVIRTTKEYIDHARDSAISASTKQYYEATTSTPNENEWYQKEPEFDKTNIKVDKDLNNDDKGNDEIFKEIDLTKAKDSYEDYVTPKRENVFESAETTKKNVIAKETRFIKVENKPEHNVGKWKKVGEKRTGTKDTQDYQYEDGATKQDPEIKARTESLIYDEQDVFSEKPTAGKGRTKPKGTNIPKRDYYKLSSPNYYANNPNIAEKYDFNEPIPEKDREPENLKDIGNPPAFINKKVRLL